MNYVQRPKGWSITSVRIDNTNADFPNSDAWRVTVRNPRGKTISRKFYKGFGHKGSKPELFEFLESLITDARCIEDVASPRQFAEEFGWEFETPEGRKRTERIYNECKRTKEALDTFLTPEEWELFGDN